MRLGGYPSEITWLGEVKFRQSNTQTTKPELIQSFEESLCILQIEANPEVEIAGVPRMAVGRQCLAPPQSGIQPGLS